MPKLQKSIQKQNLAQYQTWITDTDPTSRYFRLSQLPDVLTGGKNAFAINGSAELIGTTEVKIELIDSDGNTVFIQPIRNYVEGLARIVSIEIYADTPPGLATLTVLGQLSRDDRGNLPPDQFVNAYNVKWTKTINIAPELPNTTPIRLYQSPELTVTEILSPYRYTITGTLTRATTGSLQLIGRSDTIKASGMSFVREMNGGKFTYTVQGLPYTASIVKVVNSSLARISPPFTGSFVTTTPSSFEILYTGKPEYGISQLSRSFADIRLSKLTTFSGDVARTRIYVRGIDEMDDFKQISDISLESTNLLYTQSISTGEVSRDIGYVVDQSFVDLYWEGGLASPSGYDNTGSVTLTHDTITLLDSVYISSPLSPSSSVPSQYLRLGKDLTFFESLEYTVSCNLTCVNTTGEMARLDVYLYGDAFPPSATDLFGVKLASYVVDPTDALRQIEDVSINVFAPLDGTAKLCFVVYGGTWYVSDVRVVSARETGFNPDDINVVVPVEGRRFEDLIFKSELFDVNSNYVPVQIISPPIYFDGGNAVFRGSDNRIDGILTVSPSGSGPTLTSKGFYDQFGIFTEGQAIAIGPQTPYVRNKNTAFFAGTSSVGPEISVGDKLYGYYDYTIDQFILQIDGIIRIGSGSNFIDIRSLLPSNPSFRISEFLSGSALDFYDVRGRNSVSAGRWNDQIARMGYYTRGYKPFGTQSLLTLSQIDTTFNPYQFPTQSVTLFTSGTISIPSDHIFFNETLYTDATMQISQLELDPAYTYRMNYVVEALVGWGAYPSPSLPGQILLSDTTYYVVSSGSFPPISVVDYPIFIPRDRTDDTLYVLLRMNVTSYPTV